MGEWFPGAGRSNVALDKGVALVLVKGIPIHLRSSDLFRKLGDMCGLYLGFEAAADLNSVRIKVQVKEEIPKKVVLAFQSQKFEVSVCREDHEAAYGQPVVSGKFGGSEEDLRPQERDQGLPAAVEEALVEEGQVLFVENQVTGLEEMDVIRGPEFSSGQLRAICSIESGDVTGPFCREKLFVGLRLDANDLSIVVPPFSSDQWSVLNRLLISVGVGYSKVVSLRCPSFWASKGLTGLNLVLGPWAFSSFLEESVGKNREESGPFRAGSSGSQEQYCLEYPGSIQSFERSSADSESGADLERIVGTSDLVSGGSAFSSLVPVVEETAILLGLSLQGLVEKGVAAAVATCKEANARQESARARTRKDLELRRLGISDGEEPILKSRTRGQRCGSPIPMVLDV
ncbi:hypothetical protein LINPERPRIM_LOCUS26302 [Linum perenne]